MAGDAAAGDLKEGNCAGDVALLLARVWGLPLLWGVFPFGSQSNDNCETLLKRALSSVSPGAAGREENDSFPQMIDADLSKAASFAACYTLASFA